MKRNLTRVSFIAFEFALLANGHAWAASDDVPVPAAIAGQGYHLEKNWDFSTNVTDLTTLREQFYTRFGSNNGTLDHLNDEWEVYRDNDNHEISNGALHLIARDPSGVIQKGAIESGMIRSKWTGRYGYYEARVKLPPQRGMWPAFWFANQHWPPEIDVFEVVVDGKDNSTKDSYHGLVGKYIGKTNFSLINKQNNYHPGYDYADGFHNFAVEWTPTIVKHYVDDKLVSEREFQWRHDDGSIGEASPVIANLAVGGHWPGPPSLDGLPASMDIAYIRVWQKVP